MAAKLAFQNDHEADILQVSSRPPYPEQESEELGDGVMLGGAAKTGTGVRDAADEPGRLK